MKKLFAFEDLNDPMFVSPTVTDSNTEDLVQEESTVNELDLIKQEDDLGRALTVANTLETIAQEAMLAKEGMSPSAAKALAIAVESICKNIVPDSELKIITFEELTTIRDKRNATLEALDAIKDFGNKIWDWICKMMSMLIDKIKSIFNRKKSKENDIS